VVNGATLLHLVRHGESGWNVSGRVQGQSLQAPSLTALGRAQARTTVELLAELAPRARLVVASDLHRARETALIVAGGLGLPVRWDPGLREQDLGALECRTFDERLGGGSVAETVEGLWTHPDRRPRGGESIRDLHRRIHATLARLASETAAADLVVVTHGGPIRVATVPTADGLTRRPVANASVTRVSIPAPAWRERRAS
jgi:2,3-bisphosphoglycerate-dependent phosphoglycerate mutase